MARLWTSLRTATHPAVVQSYADPATEAKVVLSSYYGALAQAGLARSDSSRGWSVERAVAEGFERVVWIFKPVNVISGDSARLPYRLKQGGDDVDDHPIMRLLNKRANPLETGTQFRKRLSAQVLLSKRGAFVERTMSRAGIPVRYDLLPPGRVEIVPGTGNDLVDHYEVHRRDGTSYGLDPGRVLWFRDPHPLDPYSGVTPLEAAGMSIELDYFARLYNVTFLRNDGRPGGVLAVRPQANSVGDVDPRVMDRIESRFSKGPHEAGKLSVITGELSYVDLATNPRDMQYADLATSAKREILGAFGITETILGFSADRTFSNAEQEFYTYWTRTQPEHQALLLTGFDEDSEDDLEGYFDTSSVEVLERAARARREEAREEFDKGLRSPMSYLREAGREDEVEDTPAMRALYMPGGKVAVPASDADAEALAPPAEEAPAAAPAEAVTGGEPPAAVAGGEPPAVAPRAPSAAVAGGPAVAPSAPRQVDPGLPREAITTIRPEGKALNGGGRRGHVIRLHREPETKAEEPARARTSDADDAAWQRLEDDVAAALTALVGRWTERTVARIEAPKARKGTRHWAPEFAVDTRVGTKALDGPRAADEERAEGEAVDAVTPLVEAAAVAAAAGLLADLDATGDPDTDVPAVVAAVVAGVRRFVGAAAVTAMRGLAEVVNVRDQAGDPLEDIVAAVRAHGAGLRSWARAVAVQAATATTSGARDAAADEAQAVNGRRVTAAAVGDGAGASERTVDRTWLSRLDPKVRPEHGKGEGGAHGQRRALGEPFLVGGFLLRWPGDPDGPPHLTRNCRCRVRYRSTLTGRFVAAPAAARV